MAAWTDSLGRTARRAISALPAWPWYAWAGIGVGAVVLLSSKSAGASTPSAGPPRPAGNPPTIKLGAAGPWVSYLQARLGLKPTAAFDAETAKAVKSYQQSKGLTADGVVGPKTWASLGVTGSSGGGGGPPPQLPPDDVLGAEGNVFDLSDKIAERENQILSYVAAGNVDVDWVPVSWSKNGHDVMVLVTRRALALADGQGSRLTVSTSFNTAQKIADLLGASMLTTRVSDEIWKQAQKKVQPLSRPITSKTADMIDQSRRIDEAVAGATGLVANEGKDWVLTRRFWTPADGGTFQPGKCMGVDISTHNSANFGWYGSGSSKSPGGETVIQSVGLCHDRSHVDYSQLLRFMQPVVMIDGQPRQLASVLADPDLSSLLQDEGGILPGTRHPDL